MKTKLLTICLLLVTTLSGCSQGDIYSCREVKQLGSSWEYTKQGIRHPKIIIVKGKDLFREIAGEKELRAYKTPSHSTEKLVQGELTSNDIKYRWKLNTIDKIAVWERNDFSSMTKSSMREVYRCEKK